MNTEKVADIWLDSVRNLTDVFTKPGYRAFRQTLGPERFWSNGVRWPAEIISALDCQEQWRATEWFMEEGKWPTEEVKKELREND